MLKIENTMACLLYTSTVHEGANVRQMEAKGIRTEKGELNRWIKATNRLIQDVRKKIKALFVWMAEVKEELSKPQTSNLADLLIAYYNQRNAGAWSNKARTGNLKQVAEACLLYTSRCV